MLREIPTNRPLKMDWFTRALATDGFESWFQPVIDTVNHRIVGHECLIRHRDKEVRTSEEVFEAARASNLLPLFDSQAMALAIREAASELTSAATQADPGLFFINMMPEAMADPEISFRPAMDALEMAFDHAGMAPKDFVFEAVESDLVGDSARLRAVHDHVRKMGFGFGLDNAGAGSSCFELIGDLRPGYIKIDRRLIWNAEQPVCASTIRKLVELADRNGAQAIAVGVERPRMVENLWLLGVQTMQGFLFGRPSRHVSRSGEPIRSRAVSGNGTLVARSSNEKLKHSPAATVYRPELIAGHRVWQK
jgi:EAL domain-containing protein (putative c-di-GMP-specific phosphodiesterase class I)